MIELSEGIINDDSDRLFHVDEMWFDVLTYKVSKNGCYYVATGDLIALVSKWKNTPLQFDGQISGVLADYLEENMPSDPLLVRLVDYLRKRFYPIDNNTES